MFSVLLPSLVWTNNRAYWEYRMDLLSNDLYLVLAGQSGTQWSNHNHGHVPEHCQPYHRAPFNT